MSVRDHTQEKILGLEKRNILLNRGLHVETLRMQTLDESIEQVQSAILRARSIQANFAPAGSALRRVGASSLALELRKYRKRQMDDLEKELARSRRILDEASRVVSSKRDEIDLLRKQAMVLNEEFLRRSNDLDRAKVNLAICLEQANQIVKAKQFVQEQSDDLRADATKERQLWMSEREAVIARIKRLLEGTEEAPPAKDGDAAWGNLTTEQEEYALHRVKQLATSIERLEREAPFEQAELDVWESAFLRMQQGTGEEDADRLVARFLAEEQTNYDLYSYIATVSEDADNLEAMLANVHSEIAAGQDNHALKLHQQNKEKDAELAEIEHLLQDQITREKLLVSQLHSVAALLVKLYKRLNCPGAAATWAKQAKDTAVRFVHGAPLPSAPSSHNLVPVSTATAQPASGNALVAPDGASDAKVPPAPALPGRRPAAASLPPSADDGDQKEADEEVVTSPSDAWALLGEDGPPPSEAEDARPSGTAKSHVVGGKPKHARAPTPPRNLYEIAGLTGLLRGQGYDLLLAEGVIGAGATEEQKASRIDEGEEKDESRPPSLSVNIGAQLKSSSLLQPGSPFMKGVTGDGDYYDGEETNSPRAARRKPLVRSFSLTDADLLANTLMPPEQQAKVQAQTILSYMTILERRVQQLAAEFDNMVMVTSRGSTSQFGVRGPRVEHDKDRHTFHIEPPPLEDFIEEMDTTFLNTLQQHADVLHHARRASLASMVDGEATAPQGPAASGMAISQLGFPVVQPRPGTAYASVTAVQDAAQMQHAMSAAALSAGGTAHRPGTSSASASRSPSRRGASVSEEKSETPSKDAMRRASRPVNTPLYKGPRLAASSPDSHASPSAAGHRVADTLSKLGQARHQSRTPARSPSRMSVSGAMSPSTTVAPAAPAEAEEAPPVGGPSSGLHLVERTVGAVQLSSHGRGRTIVTGVHPAGYVPPMRQAYLEWVARQQPQSAETEKAPPPAVTGDQTESADARAQIAVPTATDIESRVQALRSPSRGLARRGASASPSPSPRSPPPGHTSSVPSLTRASSIPSSSGDAPFNSAVYGAGAEAIPGAQLHGSASLPFLGGPRSHVPGTSSAGSAAGRYPKVLYSGYRISNIPHESGSDFAYYSTAAARKRVQYASLSDANVAHPADTETLLRDVQKQYGQAAAAPTLEDSNVDPRIAARGSRISAYVHYGKLDEETLRERAKQRDIERRKESRRRSLQLEMQGLNKHKGLRSPGDESLTGHDTVGSSGLPADSATSEPLQQSSANVQSTIPAGKAGTDGPRGRAASHTNRGSISSSGRGVLDSGGLSDDSTSRRVSRVDPLTMAASVAMRLEREAEAAKPRKAPVQAPVVGSVGRMSLAERAAMDAEVEGALSALHAGDLTEDYPPDDEEDTPQQRRPSPTGSTGSVSGGRGGAPSSRGRGPTPSLLPALPSARSSSVPTGSGTPVPASSRLPDHRDLPSLGGRE